MTRTSTRRFKQNYNTYRTQCQTRNDPCWICGQPIDYQAPHNDYTNDNRYQLDHYYPVSTHPQLQNDTTNFRPSHAGCNNTRSNNTNTTTLTGTLSRNWTG